MQDRYGFALSTASAAARDAYLSGVDLALSANDGAEEQFRHAIAGDDGFALAHIALARTVQLRSEAHAAKAAAQRARALAKGLPHRERSHGAALATIVDGGNAAGFAAAQEHLKAYPRDAMVLAPCTGVFGLIGFSGRAGREAELLSFIAPFADAYGDDWWFQTAHAFALVEVGEIARARLLIERALAQFRATPTAHISAPTRTMRPANAPLASGSCATGGAAIRSPQSCTAISAGTSRSGTLRSARRPRPGRSMPRICARVPRAARRSTP